MERLKRMVHLSRSSVPKASTLTTNDGLPYQKMVNVESNFVNLIESADPLCMQNDPHSIQEALAAIEQPYYSPTFDSGKYEIGTTAGFSCRELGRMKIRLLSLDRQNRAVSRRVSELVLEKHPRYETELKGVLSLQADNLATLAMCREVRSVLKKSREALVTLRLTVLRNFRRRKRLQQVLRILRQISILRVNARQLDTMLSFSEYHAAIRLHRESLVVLEEYHQYHCTEWMHFKLKAFGSRIDDILDNELKESCTNFSEPAYTTIQRAFELLGSTQTTVTQLQMHYVCAVHSRSLDALREYAVANNSVAQLAEQRSETAKLDGHINSIENYKHLCSTVSLRQLPDCLIAVCQSLGKILVCYHRTMMWHKARARGEDWVVAGATSTVLVPPATLSNQRPDGHKRTGASCHKCPPAEELLPVGCDAPDGTTSSSRLTGEGGQKQDSDQLQLVRQWHDYVAWKLIAGRLRIWSEVVERVEPLLKAVGSGAVDMGFDEVARILSLVNRFISIGEEFSGRHSSDLLSVLRSSICNFFRSFHRMHMERLRMFLEHETWDLCPVPSVFTIFDLQEFRDVALLFTQSSASLPPATLGSPSPARCNSIFEPPYEVDQFFHLHPLCNDNEVLKGNLETIDNVASNDFHSARTENTQGFPSQKITSQHFPTLSNTTLEVLRLIGRYTQIMVLLQPIADKVMHCICQVFDYYLYSVFTFFGPTQVNSVELPDRLRQTLKRIRDRLISTNSLPSNASEDRFPLPQHEPMHLLNCLDQMNGSNGANSDGRPEDLWCSNLQAMLVGVESVVWLAETVDRVLLPNLSNCLPERQRSLVLVFREQGILSAELLREPCAASLMPRLFQLLMPRATASAVPHSTSASQSTTSSIASGLSRIWPLSTGGGGGGGASTAEKEISVGGGGAAGLPGSGTTSSSLLVTSGLGTTADEANLNPLLSYISAIMWKSKAGVNVLAGPSSYVQKLNVCVFLPFSNRLQLLGQRLHLPDSLKVILWTALLTHIANCLLDAFGEVRSCSEEGRGQMLLDIRSMATLGETISEIRPFPRTDRLTEYVHAFFQPTHCWDQWLTSHAGQYTRSQLNSLAECIARGDWRQRQRLRATINSHLTSQFASPLNPSSTSSGASQLTSPSISSSASTTSAAGVRE